MKPTEKARLSMRATAREARNMLRTPTGTREEEHEKKKQRTREHAELIWEIRKKKHGTDQKTAEARNSTH